MSSKTAEFVPGLDSTDVARVSDEQRHALVLRAWEAINAERELAGVLAAVSEVLVPLVPFEGVALAPFADEACWPYAFHVVSSPDESRSAEEVWRAYAVHPLPVRPAIPYEGSDLWREHKAGLSYACANLLEKEAWLPHESKLAAAGVRAYAACPLQVRGKPVGVAIFCRGAPVPFPTQQLAVLSDVSRALAVAVANALANQEICALRDQLEAENLSLRAQLKHSPRFENIIGDSPALNRVLQAVEHVAVTDTTVLLTGETGTGKELVARAIHERSSRSQGPLIPVHCAAIPQTLLASELFGHERGAFTGAVDRRKGRFEQAHRGTLFLDEVGELPPEAQVMLLRVLQERAFERLGGNETVRVDVRIVAATNRDLMDEVRACRFREDLFYRLNVFPIRIPPLRDRPEDIAPLVSHFAEKHAARLGRAITRIGKRSLRLLESYRWPGNVRELENTVERAVILSRNGILRLDRESPPVASASGDIQGHLREQERQAIEAALRASCGRVAGPNGAAKRLGLAPSTLDFRIRRLGIDKVRYGISSADK